MKYAVISIPDIYTVIIDAGTDEGIALGDTFIITGPKADIKSIDGREVLGVLRKEKATVVVTDVQKKICICVNKASAPGAMEALASAFSSTQPPASLPVNENQLGVIGYDENGIISIGDNAELLPRPQESV